MDAEDEIRIHMSELASDFYSGSVILERLAAWAYVVANQQTVLEHLAAFERAYEEFVKLHAEGKLTAGTADMSAENLARVKRVIHLIQPGLDSVEARQAAQEIHALAEQCVQGLTRGNASPADPARLSSPSSSRGGPMGLATEVANAISEGINDLCALLAWNDAGAVGDPPVDGATLGKTMAAVEAALQELLHGGQIYGEIPFTDEDLARVIRLEALIPEWPSKGALSPEVVALAEAFVSAFCGGKSWRELIAAARR